MRGELVEDVARLEELRGAWDDLAVESASPYSAPGWLLPWWGHAAPAGARLCVVAVHDGGELAGLAPFFSAGRELHLLGARTSLGVQPLAPRGDARDVAAAFAEVIAGTGARVIHLEGVPASARWREQLTSVWPEKPWARAESTTPAPRIEVANRSFDEWLATLNGKFRKNIRRLARRLDERGAVYRLAADPAEIERDVSSFVALHHARWATRGGSGVVNDGVERMLHEAARELVPSRRLRLWSMDIDGKTIASELFVAGGGLVSSWLGGFDDAWGVYEPSKHLILKEIEHAFSRGEAAVDLGPGQQEFKDRFTEQSALLEWSVLVPRGRGYGAARLGVAARDLRGAAARRIPPDGKRMLKRILGRAA